MSKSMFYKHQEHLSFPRAGVPRRGKSTLGNEGTSKQGCGVAKSPQVDKGQVSV
jgi:hypothetical protein